MATRSIVFDSVGKLNTAAQQRRNHHPKEGTSNRYVMETLGVAKICHYMATTAVVLNNANSFRRHTCESTTPQPDSETTVNIGSRTHNTYIVASTDAAKILSHAAQFQLNIGVLHVNKLTACNNTTASICCIKFVPLRLKLPKRCDMRFGRLFTSYLF